MEQNANILHSTTHLFREYEKKMFFIYKRSKFLTENTYVISFIKTLAGSRLCFVNFHDIVVKSAERKQKKEKKSSAHITK